MNSQASFEDRITVNVPGGRATVIVEAQAGDHDTAEDIAASLSETIRNEHA